MPPFTLPPTTGRIDVHSHLLPGVDDGCKTVAESLECARMLVGAGYTHGFVTPHVWPHYPNTTRANVPRWAADLQAALDAWKIPYTLLPGAEMNLSERTPDTPDEQLISMALGGRYMLFDVWADRLPYWFEPHVRWLQAKGLTLVLAHPERMRAVQDEPELADYFADLGLLLQGNLQCFADPPHAATRRVAERYLRDGRYFLLGSDTHNPQSLPVRLEGLRNAVALAGDEAVDRLTKENPRELVE